MSEEMIKAHRDDAKAYRTLMDKTECPREKSILSMKAKFHERTADDIESLMNALMESEKEVIKWEKTARDMQGLLMRIENSMFGFVHGASIPNWFSYIGAIKQMVQKHKDILSPVAQTKK